LEPKINDISYGLLWYIVFIISATVHEAAHAWAAKLGGDLTAYSGGQVSLNPWPHIRREIWGMVIIPIVTAIGTGWPIGWATTPYDAEWAYNHPRKAAWMAAAGPAANLLIVVICYAIIQAGIVSGYFLQPEIINMKHLFDAADGGQSGLTLFVSMLFTMNLILAVLNITPSPPLDGSSIISLFLHDNAARGYQRVVHNPIFGLVGLILAWFVFSPLFHWVFVGSINVVYWGSNYR
jgi:Zn-dependent protease